MTAILEHQRRNLKKQIAFFELDLVNIGIELSMTTCRIKKIEQLIEDLHKLHDEL